MPDATGTADDIWRDLVAGADRGRTANPVLDPDDHSPVAVVLTCSDARVPPSLVFDEPRNRLFEVRVPGGGLDDTVREAIDFAVDHLHVPLVVVLGHENCAAVGLAVETRDAGTEPGTLGATVAAIRRSVGDASAGDAIAAHVRSTVADLRTTIGDAATVVGAITHLGSGRLEVVDTD
jgi:carbonic anhydrase